MYLCQELAIGHRRRVVASGLSHHFRAGTLTLLTGRNGAGKSTLLLTLAGLLPPLSPPSTLLLRDRPLASYDSRCLARLRALVLARCTPVELRVRQVVEMGRMPHTAFDRRLTAGDQAAVDEALRQCSLTDYADRSFLRLSDGERQRVMIAAALAQEAPCLLLDEPTAFLDYDSRHHHFQLLRQLADQGRCVIVSTHDLDAARPLADAELTL